MCGIVGSVSRNFHFTEKHVDILSHRGPDDSGYFLDNDVMLGHRRLSIIDTSANGHQPMFSRDGRIALIFNGEIYNYQAIKKELISKGYVFRSHSDSEVLIYGYMEYGRTLVNHLNGIFAFAIYDKNAGTVFIARDQLGVKPLYYYNRENIFAFASELKIFKAIPGFDRSLDVHALSYYLQALYGPGEVTPFQHVKKLLPGHYLIYDVHRHTLAVTRYYDVSFHVEQDTVSEKEWIDRLDSALQKAVERQLMSDVPLGYFLSGGLDSSLVVAMAKKLLPQSSLTCFTIATGPEMKKEGFADDEYYAQIVAKALGVKLEIIPAHVDMLAQFDKMIWHLDEPQADPAPISVNNICDGAVQKGIKVLLSGAGGDDVFTGYRRHQALNLEKYIAMIPGFAARQIQSAAKRLNSSSPLGRRIQKIAHDISLTKDERLAGYFMWLDDRNITSLYREEQRAELLRRKMPREYWMDLLRSLPASTDDINKMLYLELRTFLPDHNLNYFDKMGMASSVEIRVPFLDMELIDLAGKMPPHLKMGGNVTKYLLRKVGERYLPKEVVYRPKTGFGAPVRQWIKSSMKPMIAERLSGASLDRSGIFDSKNVQHLIRLNLEGKVDAAYTIWALLSIDSWMTQFRDT
ncbi:MAG TPA: asparagine synthase (glutamine-hydrolyzing) [Bacteroidota bacterium]|nr:asparagine synthase (glutamine-hydrolyzing) [Bacteroidota bacterium]